MKRSNPSQLKLPLESSRFPRPNTSSSIYTHYPTIVTHHLLPSSSSSSSKFALLHFFVLQGKMSRPGDWNCRSCQHLNFQRRDSCHRCGEPKSGGGGGGGGDFGGFGSRFGGVGGGASPFGFTGPDVRPGDWYCVINNCGAHNFASRSSCFKCGVFKDIDSSSSFDGDMSRGGGGRGFGGGSSGGSVRSGWKSGDWICTRPGCNEHNFASRMECFRCNAPRESGGGSGMSSTNY